VSRSAGRFCRRYSDLGRGFARRGTARCDLKEIGATFKVDGPIGDASQVTLEKGASLVERGKTLRDEVAPVFGRMDQARKRLEGGVHTCFPRLLNNALSIIMQNLAFPGLNQEGRKTGKVTKIRRDIGVCERRAVGDVNAGDPIQSLAIE